MHVCLCVCLSLLTLAARITWHRLILGSIYMDSVYKKDLAITLTANYCQLQKNFVADSHHHDVCVSYCAANSTT